jgi:hypothetical protein
VKPGRDAEMNFSEEMRLRGGGQCQMGTRVHEVLNKAILSGREQPLTHRVELALRREEDERGTVYTAEARGRRGGGPGGNRGGLPRADPTLVRSSRFVRPSTLPRLEKTLVRLVWGRGGIVFHRERRRDGESDASIGEGVYAKSRYYATSAIRQT